MEFKPPDLTFTFAYEQRILLWSPPIIYLTLGFDASVTLSYALVLDSKGIREAVEQKKPEKALESIAIRDVIDGVNTPIVTFSITVSAAIEVSGKITRLTFCTFLCCVVLFFFINSIHLCNNYFVQLQL